MSRPVHTQCVRPHSHAAAHKAQASDRFTPSARATQAKLGVGPQPAVPLAAGATVFVARLCIERAASAARSTAAGKEFGAEQELQDMHELQAQP
jgi:hypothetical protein